MRCGQRGAANDERFWIAHYANGEEYREPGGVATRPGAGRTRGTDGEAGREVRRLLHQSSLDLLGDGLGALGARPAGDVAGERAGAAARGDAGDVVRHHGTPAQL